MTLSSIMLLPATNAKFNVTGDPQRADGYWGSTSTTHTISIHVHQFTGRIYIEAKHRPRYVVRDVVGGKDRRGL